MEDNELIVFPSDAWMPTCTYTDLGTQISVMTQKTWMNDLSGPKYIVQIYTRQPRHGSIMSYAREPGAHTTDLWFDPETTEKYDRHCKTLLEACCYVVELQRMLREDGLL